MPRFESDSTWNRRTFIRNTSLAATTIGLGLTKEGVLEAAEAEKSSEKDGIQFRTLGRTGLKVSEIAFGGTQVQDVALLEAAIDRGINLIHTSPGYGQGKSIQLSGQVMKTKRKKVVLALKASPVDGIDEHLKALNTDHVDILIPPMHSVKRINTPELPEAFEKLKKEGKIRFSGFSCHKAMAQVMQEATRLGFWDVMLVDYNLSNRASLNSALAKARKEQNIGFMAMKVTRGMDKDQPEALAAAFKKLLANKNVDTLLIGMANFDDLKRNAAVSGKAMGFLDRRPLDRYARAAEENTCAMCDACGICPKDVLVSDIFRCKAYYDRGEQELAVRTYRSLPVYQRAGRCDDCGQCMTVCPKSLDIVREIREVHTRLS